MDAVTTIPEPVNEPVAMVADDPVVVAQSTEGTLELVADRDIADRVYGRRHLIRQVDDRDQRRILRHLRRR